MNRDSSWKLERSSKEAGGPKTVGLCRKMTLGFGGQFTEVLLKSWPIWGLFPQGHCSPLETPDGTQLSAESTDCKYRCIYKREKGRKPGSWEIYRDLTLQKLELVVFSSLSCFWAETHSGQRSHVQTLKVICFGWMSFSQAP